MKKYKTVSKEAGIGIGLIIWSLFFKLPTKIRLSTPGAEGISPPIDIEKVKSSLIRLNSSLCSFEEAIKIFKEEELNEQKQWQSEIIKLEKDIVMIMKHRIAKFYQEKFTDKEELRKIPTQSYLLIL